MTEAASILVVDDDEVLRPRLVRAFRDRGLRAQGAAGCGEARDLLEREAFDMAVVDLRMPDGSGLDIVSSIKERSPRTRVVVLTGYGSIATAVEAMRLGATSYLPKPADADEVLLAFERGNGPPAHDDRDSQPSPRAPSLARAEWEHLNRVLADCGGNISEAARRLGIHRRSLQRKLQKYPPRD